MTKPQALARQLRPQTFSDVEGQAHVIRALTHALTEQRLHHAYLFTGTRGVGKTTLARILAKCLNCDTGVSAQPCGECQSCQDIANGCFIDLIEVDAASRTRVEETRELLDNIQYAPTQGRYKVYLIDEVHMLSNHSFNALLKTLEEPPEHTKFLLATTDPQKLPKTVLSRCLQFTLKPLPPEQIQDYLQRVLTQQSISFEEKGLWLLACAADGSVRDALSLLDQAIAYSHNNLTAESMQEMLGHIEQQYLFDLLFALADRHHTQLSEALKKVADAAPDFAQTLEQLLSLLHHIALTQTLPDYQPSSSLFDQEKVQALAQKLSPEDVQLYYQMALHGRRDLPLAPTPRSGFEMTLLRMLSFVLTDAPTPARKPPSNTAATSSNTPQTTAAPPRAAEPTPPRPTRQTTPPPLAKPTQEKVERIPLAMTPEAERWQQWMTQIELQGMPRSIAEHSVLISYENQLATLHITRPHYPMVSDRQKEYIAEALSKHLNETVQVMIESSDNLELPTPAKIREVKQQEAKDQAAQRLSADPNVQLLESCFDASLGDATISVPAPSSDPRPMEEAEY